MWFALKSIYGSVGMPILGLYEWQTQRYIVGGHAITEHYLCLIAWLIDCCCEAIPAILDEVDP